MSPWSVTPASCITRDDLAEGFLRERVGLRCRCESRDVALEEQLASRGFLEREVDECMQELLQRLAPIGRQLDGVETLEELPVAVSEHRVVQGMLRVEVLVERRLAHAHLARQPPKRDTGDAVRSSELPSGVDDLRGSGEATFHDGRCGHQRSPLLPIIDRTITYR